MKSKPPSEPPRPSELTESGSIKLPRVSLAPRAGEFLADRLTYQHRDELDTRKLRALRLD